ncbi:hypothetical protein BJX99DRAFT_269051 [Aspergillus californicus]
MIKKGWNGLVSAKTVLQIDPSLTVVVLESATSVGGVWCRERLYNGLQTNNVLGSYEFSDFPMIDVIPDLKPGKHIPGKAVHAYLEAYTKHFDFADRIRLECAVECIEYTPDKSWIVKGFDQKKNEGYSILARKLIMATGLTSQARIPVFDGQDTFGKPMFHVKDLALHQHTVTGDSDTPVTVLGGGKSAWDAVYTCASTGRQVDWIIRESGHGPVWMAPTLVTPFKLYLEKLPVVRALSWFSPCAWADPSSASRFVRRFLHGTWLGQKVVRSFWWLLEQDLLQATRYEDHEETAKLRPWVGPFSVSTVIGVLNYPTDLFALIRKGLVRIHVADITRITPGAIHLSDGRPITESSGLILCTGWKATPNIRFLPEGIEERLGVPWAKDLVDQDLVREIRSEILDEYPDLSNMAAPNALNRVKTLPTSPDATTLHPFRLARFIAPVAMYKDNSVAFTGNISTFHAPLVAEVQALWAAAYLFYGIMNDGRPGKMDIVRETVLHTEFCRLRSPWGYGPRNADFVFDVLPYIDLLLNDLGLQTRRKRLLCHVFNPHGVGDYRGLVQEWKTLVTTRE